MARLAPTRNPTDGKRWRQSCAALMVAAAFFSPQFSQAGIQAGEAPEPAAQNRAESIAAERARTQADLAGIANTISLTKDGIASLDAEIAALAKDRESISKAMIAAAGAQKSIAAEIAATEGRIGDLAGDEASLKASFRARRGLLAEVLGALERMGRKPPPALLVKPDDALGSVRSAILLGAVVPKIRKETEALAGDLEQLAAVKREMAGERQRYVDQMTQQREEETRLVRLFTEKEKLEASNRDRRAAEGARAAELAAKATSLQDLIASLKAEEDGARAAEAAANRQADAARQAQDAANAPAALRPGSQDGRSVAGVTAPEGLASVPAKGDDSYDVASLRRDMNRLEPSAAFSTMKASLTLPMSGILKTGFGDSDGIGRPASGQSFLGRAGDVVTAPADGIVLYSGPFRSYGQLLILDVGDGYHVVMAGMSKIDVGIGQSVLSGEPIAVMGVRRVASIAASEIGAAEPILYLEFRKDGKPVDPAPWWADGPSGRTRNDS